MDLYLLPGLAADHRLFARMAFEGHTVHHLDHPVMPKGSTLRDFARRHAASMDRTCPHILIGVSMGGMLALELAAMTGPERTIIISSWKGPQEMPPPIKLLRGTHPERVLTKNFLDHSLPFARWQMGIGTSDDADFFDAMIHRHSAEQMRVQVNACLTWEGPPALPERLQHIHGDADRLMPIAYIRDPVVIRGGGHFMVHTLAHQVRAAMDLDQTDNISGLSQ